MHEEHFLSSWLREDVEGKAEDMESASREAKEEESKSDKREVGKERGRVEVNTQRVPFGRSPSLSSRGECFEVTSDLEVRSVGVVSECALARVFYLTASPDVDCDLPAVLFSKNMLNLSVPQTLSFSEKRGAGGAFSLCTQFKRAKMNIEGPPVKAVPESITRRHKPQSSNYKAVPECLRSRALPPREWTPLQQTATWPGPPKDPPAEACCRRHRFRGGFGGVVTPSALPRPQTGSRFW